MNIQLSRKLLHDDNYDTLELLAGKLPEQGDVFEVIEKTSGDVRTHLLLEEKNMDDYRTGSEKLKRIFISTTLTECKLLTANRAVTERDTVTFI